MEVMSYSDSTHGRVILRECLFAKSTTSWSKSKSLTILLWIFMLAKAESLSSDIVERRYVLSNFSWLLALSFSHVVTGSVHAMVKSLWMLGNESSSQHCKASCRLSGLLLGNIELHLNFHLLNSVERSWGDGRSDLYKSPTFLMEEAVQFTAVEGTKLSNFIFVWWIEPNLASISEVK